MNKTEFVSLMSKKTKMPKTKCELFLNEFKSMILEVCSKGEEINLRNFGKFSMQEKKSKKIFESTNETILHLSTKEDDKFQGIQKF